MRGDSDKRLVWVELRTESRERKGGPVRLLSLPFFSTSSMWRKGTLQEMLSETKKGEKGGLGELGEAASLTDST